jgi:hypothetical protein
MGWCSCAGSRGIRVFKISFSVISFHVSVVVVGSSNSQGTFREEHTMIV